MPQGAVAQAAALLLAELRSSLGMAPDIHAEAAMNGRRPIASASEAIAIQQGDVGTVVEFDGHRLLTSHFFFGDFNERPVALKVGHEFEFLPTEDGRVASAKREARLAGVAQRWPSEHAFVHQITASLSANGIRHRREVETPYGNIDVLIEGDPPSIIEAKAAGDARSIGQAIGQLFLYAQAYPGARLYVATPEPIASCMLPALSRCGVQIWAKVESRPVWR